MNHNKITLDDPRLTTYALGELDDANERRLVENALALDPALRTYVDEIQSLGVTLKEEFFSESTPSLERPVEEDLEPQKQASAWRYAWPMGLAASIALVIAIQTKPWASLERRSESGIVSAPQATNPVAMDQKLKDQADKVEEARLRMLNLAERHQIVDLADVANSPSITGDPVTGQARVLLPSMMDTYQSEAAVAGLKAQKDALEGLEGDQLLQSAAMLDINDPTLQKLWPTYQQAALNRQSMVEQGIDEKHPRMKETTATLEQTQGMLLAATKSMKATMDAKLAMANQSMALARSAKEENARDDSMDEGRKVAEYSEASREYNLQRAMLANMQASSAGELSGPEPNLALAADRGTDGPRANFAVDSADEVGDMEHAAEESLPSAQVSEKELPYSGRRKMTRGTNHDRGRGGRPVPPATPKPDIRKSTESYAHTHDNAFKEIVNPGDERSTFSTDVDTASYANIRRFLTLGQRPPRDAVRIEEMINYFDYAYPNPADDEGPFTMNLEVNEAPWTPGHRLLRIGLKAKDVMVDRRPDSNLVFLVDVSGSMSPYNKLPLLKQCLTSLTRGLTERDFVSIVIYSGESRVVLEPTNGNDKSVILSAIDGLQSGGSTNGESGIQLAYDLAKKHARANGSNRVLLATDGDFNVGVTSTPKLIEMAKKRAKEDHIFLTVLGFGEGNVQDDRMEHLANQVDGAYHYIDSEQEGHKVLIEEMSATLVTAAKDVKLQVEFNPAKVKKYRLIGYANRLLKNRDFRDDTKDAGDMGAGHRVTAFYEIVPVGHTGVHPSEAPLKYRAPKPAPVEPQQPFGDAVDELVTVRLSYKEPKGAVSQQREFTLKDDETTWNDASEDFRFAASVAAFGMHLRQSPHCSAKPPQISGWAKAASTRDEFGRRQEFVGLVNATQQFQ